MITRDKKIYRILVIEDNPGDFFIVKDLLSDYILNPVITNAVNFKEAVALVSAADNVFDVILLDISLPDKSGKALVTEMLQAAPLCPIIILTGYTDVDFSIKSISQGIMDYLLKDELNAAVLYKSVIYSIERKKSVSDLTETKKRYSDLFHLSPQPMWVFELETLQFIDVNNAAIKHYGYSLEEFLQMTINEMGANNNNHGLENFMQNARQHDKLFFKDAVRHKKKNGQIIHVELHSDTITINHRKARLTVINDITERIKYVEAIEKQNEKLREIAWIQSHIVRAPLARMLGIINLVKELKTESTESEALLGYLVDSCNELDTIIIDIANKSHKVNIDD